MQTNYRSEPRRSHYPEIDALELPEMLHAPLVKARKHLEPDALAPDTVLLEAAKVHAIAQTLLETVDADEVRDMAERARGAARDLLERAGSLWQPR